MLHLPLEPHQNDEHYPEDYIIKTTMPKDLVVRRFNESLDDVPHATGVNNHMGSKATESALLMGTIFDELKNRNLFFIDSRTTSKSVCRSLAKEKNIPFAERDVFLDNVNTREAIEQQFEEVAEKARKKGYVIAIGHARELTWKIIKEQTELLTEEGYEVVSAESLVNYLSNR